MRRRRRFSMSDAPTTNPEARRRLAAQNFRRAQGADRREGLPPRGRDAARGRPVRPGQRRVPLHAVPGGAQEPELDRSGPGQPEGGGASRQPPRGSLGRGRPRAPRAQAGAGGRAVRAARGLARPTPENEELLQRVVEAAAAAPPATAGEHEWVGSEKEETPVEPADAPAQPTASCPACSGTAVERLNG